MDLKRWGLKSLKSTLNEFIDQQTKARKLSLMKTAEFSPVKLGDYLLQTEFVTQFQLDSNSPAPFLSKQILVLNVSFQSIDIKFADKCGAKFASRTW